MYVYVLCVCACVCSAKVANSFTDAVVCDQILNACVCERGRVCVPVCVCVCLHVCVLRVLVRACVCVGVAKAANSSRRASVCEGVVCEGAGSPAPPDRLSFQIACPSGCACACATRTPQKDKDTAQRHRQAHTCRS